LIFDYNSQAAWPTWWRASDWGQNEVFMLYRHKVVSGWGGRVIDGHSEVSDQGIDDYNSSPAYEPGSGVSAFAIDHRSQHNGWGVYLEAQSGRTLSGSNPYVIRTGQGVGAWVFFAVHLRMARSTGFVKVWDLTGKTTFNPAVDTPAVNATAVNTIWPGQSVMHFFGPGPYNTPGENAVVQSAGPQFGKTGWAQAFSDQPVDTGEVAGAGPNDYSVQVAATDTGGFAQLT
jgi:hypothetical protein